MSEKTKQNNTKMNKQNRSNKRSRRKEKKIKKQKQKNDKHLNTHLIIWYYVELKDSRHLSTPVLKFI